MALLAPNACVFAQQDVSGLAMVETLQRRKPVDQREIFTVMFGVAFRAVLFIGETRVQAASGGNLASDFCMAAFAIEHSRSLANDMAGRALRRTAQRLVRFR
jgi:hypothetical protein